jgi:hypothetical protein
MHILIGLGIVAALVGFAFGERAAQAVVGVTLATLALLAVTFFGTMIYVVHRDNAVYAVNRQRTACVKMADAMPLTGDCR